MILVLALGALSACGSKTTSARKAGGNSSTTAGGDGSQRSASCPLEQPAPERLPGVTEQHRRASYWESILKERDGLDLDKVLLSGSDIKDLNASYDVKRPGFFSQADLLAPLDSESLQDKIEERFIWMQGKLEAKEYRKDAGDDAFSKPRDIVFAPELKVALDDVQLFCVPTTAGFFDFEATSTRINRNTCSAAHAQELIQVVGPWSGGMSLARTSTSWGFIRSDSPLSKEISEEEALRFARGPYAIVSAKEDAAPSQAPVPAHSRLPFVHGDSGAVLLASAESVSSLTLAEGSFKASTQPFTRRAVIRQALSYLGEPYGFGGLGGGIDCSRLQLDLFGAFGIKLPRFSGWQSKAGTYSIDVEGVSDVDKLRIIEQASESGVVIMHLPGHIMLYLGRDAEDVPMAIHALSYYLDTCDTGEETSMVVGKVQVGGLELGRGTRKTALIERINRLSVLGETPTESIRGIAKLRPAAPVSKPTSSECKKLPGNRLFVSPKRPERGQSTRVVATTRKHLGPARLSFYDSKGRRHESKTIETKGPPVGYIGSLVPDKEGTWTAVLGDGDKQYACTTFRVSRKKSRPDWERISMENKKNVRLARKRDKERGSDSPSEPTPVLPDSDSPEALAASLAASKPIWKTRQAWGPITEDLFAVFTERLFDYPEGDDRTWPNLHTLLRDSERNILFDHLSKSEEEVLKFVPDCADLPYTLRAYFAWKLRLPFGVYQCHRARDNRPPTCDLAGGNLMPRSEFAGTDGVTIFRNFVNYHVRRTVHSSSGRTAPDDSESDFYPVALSRKTLRPGTLFTDPYGHLLVVVRWIDQGATGYGGLIGADAQPDGTIGRRRFWRGSFLFRPETHSGGAGFKAFRPWVYNRATEALETRSNDELRRNSTARFSREQYQGSESDFYDKMESIINPRALDPVAKMRALIDALQEQVTRRTTSVNTGEDFMRSRNFEPIDMPVGKKIFLTSGPWEDFSTPSRDWRLLIAIHTVVDFPDAVLRSPKQYGIAEADAKSRVAELREILNKELALRPLPYTRSDGSDWELSLKDLIDRRVEFEMSYNPNDCPELRWAAPKGSEEYTTCVRNAPADQRSRMIEYRHWFSERRRPAI
ncbi:MAG: C40 family peptidase [Myxococcales bacterium]|nr:C40 family peptidase [Myxococcales bacterium]